MGGYSFLPPFFGVDLPPCLLEQCSQDGCSQVTRHPGTILPGKPAPGKSTCPRPAQRARSPKREAEHPWDTTACDTCRLGEAFQPTLDSSQQLSRQTCPAWHLCVPMPHDTGSAVPLYLAKGNEGCPGSCWCGSGLSATDHQG